MPRQSRPEPAPQQHEPTPARTASPPAGTVAAAEHHPGPAVPDSRRRCRGPVPLRCPARLSGTHCALCGWEISGSQCGCRVAKRPDAGFSAAAALQPDAGCACPGGSGLWLRRLDRRSGAEPLPLLESARAGQGSCRPGAAASLRICRRVRRGPSGPCRARGRRRDAELRPAARRSNPLPAPGLRAIRSWPDGLQPARGAERAVLGRALCPPPPFCRPPW